MLNFFAKSLLVLTSFSPVLVVMAISQFERGVPWTSYIWWLMAAFVLAVCCWMILRYAERKAEMHIFQITEFERKDQELLVFLFIYLLPFIRSGNVEFASQWLTSIVVLAIIAISIALAGAFHFNPVMRTFGYRFYAVKNHHGIPVLLISKKKLRCPEQRLHTVQLAWDVYLDKGDCSA